MISSTLGYDDTVRAPAACRRYLRDTGSLLGQGWSENDILRNYPGLTHEDIAACLQYASEVLQAEKVYPLARA